MPLISHDSISAHDFLLRSENGTSFSPSSVRSIYNFGGKTRVELDYDPGLFKEGAWQLILLDKSIIDEHGNTNEGNQVLHSFTVTKAKTQGVYASVAEGDEVALSSEVSAQAGPPPDGDTSFSFGLYRLADERLIAGGTYPADVWDVYTLRAAVSSYGDYEFRIVYLPSGQSHVLAFTVPRPPDPPEPTSLFVLTPSMGLDEDLKLSVYSDHLHTVSQQRLLVNDVVYNMANDSGSRQVTLSLADIGITSAGTYVLQWLVSLDDTVPSSSNSSERTLTVSASVTAHIDSRPAPSIAAFDHEMDNGKVFAQLLIDQGAHSAATKAATNETIGYWEAVRASGGPGLAAVAEKNRDFWSMLGDLHDGQSLGTINQINFGAATAQDLLQTWGHYTAAQAQAKANGEVQTDIYGWLVE